MSENKVRKQLKSYIYKTYKDVFSLCIPVEKAEEFTSNSLEVRSDG